MPIFSISGPSSVLFKVTLRSDKRLQVESAAVRSDKFLQVEPTAPAPPQVIVSQTCVVPNEWTHIAIAMNSTQKQPSLCKNLSPSNYLVPDLSKISGSMEP